MEIIECGNTKKYDGYAEQRFPRTFKKFTGKYSRLKHRSSQKNQQRNVGKTMMDPEAAQGELVNTENFLKNSRRVVKT